MLAGKTVYLVPKGHLAGKKILLDLVGIACVGNTTYIQFQGLALHGKKRTEEKGWHQADESFEYIRYLSSEIFLF
jgi:hypothetical protein